MGFCVSCLILGLLKQDVNVLVKEVSKSPWKLWERSRMAVTAPRACSACRGHTRSARGLVRGRGDGVGAGEGPHPPHFSQQYLLPLILGGREDRKQLGRMEASLSELSGSVAQTGKD